MLVSFCEILWASKGIINVKKMLSFLSLSGEGFEVRCTTFSIMAKKYSAYAFILFCAWICWSPTHNTVMEVRVE